MIFPRKDVLHISVLHSGFGLCPILDLDDSAARKMPGVHEVLSYKNVNRNIVYNRRTRYPEPSPYDSFYLMML